MTKITPGLERAVKARKLADSFASRGMPKQAERAENFSQRARAAEMVRRMPDSKYINADYDPDLGATRYGCKEPVTIALGNWNPPDLSTK